MLTLTVSDKMQVTDSSFSKYRLCGYLYYRGFVGEGVSNDSEVDEIDNFSVFRRYNFGTFTPVTPRLLLYCTSLALVTAKQMTLSGVTRISGHF